MVREIINVQVGQCGNQVANVFWSTMGKEHKVGLNGKFKGDAEVEADRSRLDKIEVFFQELGTLRYVPRTCMVDLDPGIMDVIKASPMGALFKPDNMVSGQGGAGNNWAKGFYKEGAEMIDEVMDTIRRETEACDCLQGFQMTHALSGGTGSGLGSLLLLRIRDNYPDRITATFSVTPSWRMRHNDGIGDPYNATLSIHQLLENSDQTFVIDHEALFSIAYNVLKQQEPKYADLNWVISMTMSGITASLRFSGKLNSDLRKMGTNLVPFPRLHFLLSAQAPLFAKDTLLDSHNNANGGGIAAKVKVNVQEITDQMWSPSNFLIDVKRAEDGKYLSASCLYRGDIQTQEVEDEIAKIQAKLSDDFVQWIPNNIKSAVITVPPEDNGISGTFVANTTAIKGVFQRISAHFARMYKRKMWLHWYKGEGMDEMEFQEADKNVRDLITEYQDKQDAVADWSHWWDDLNDDIDQDDIDSSEENEEEKDSDDGQKEDI